ncbi:MAG: DNA repair protein RecO [Pseudomonadota bacterium]
MQWQDQGIVLGAKRFSDTGMVVTVFAAQQGIWRGLARGHTRLRREGLLEPGTGVVAQWRARLADQLGTFTLEAETYRAAKLMHRADVLAALTAACDLAREALPEREPYEGVFRGLEVLLDSLGQEGLWPALYCRWELGLLEATGYGLDLTKCAQTGATDDLTHVSPRTGRAVCRAVAEPYLDKLLPLPAFLLASQAGFPTQRDISNSLILTGTFLRDRLFAEAGRPLPSSRDRLVTLLARRGGPNSVTMDEPDRPGPTDPTDTD